MIFVMPKKSQLKLPPLPTDNDETIGQRLARIRKEKGYTQTELAEKVGLIQVLISDYERGKLRLNAEMVIRLAKGLGVSADELLGLRKTAASGKKINSRTRRRIEQIDALPSRQQGLLLKMVDTFLKGAAA